MTSQTSTSSDDQPEGDKPTDFAGQIRQAITGRRSKGKTSTLRERLVERWAADNTDKQGEKA